VRTLVFDARDFFEMLCLSDFGFFLLRIHYHFQVDTSNVVLFGDDLHVGFVVDRVLKALAQTFGELYEFLLLLKR